MLLPLCLQGVDLQSHAFLGQPSKHLPVLGSAWHAGNISASAGPCSVMAADSQQGPALAVFCCVENQRCLHPLGLLNAVRVNGWLWPREGTAVWGVGSSATPKAGWLCVHHMVCSAASTGAGDVVAHT